LLHGTVTGRLSSRKPNLQNIPRDSKIKNIFCAAPGNVLIEFDYKGAELRVLAYLSQDDFLRNVFLTGRDLHDEVAAFLFGQNFTKEQRVKAKNVNFGIAYGRTHYTIAEEFKMSEIEAKALLDEWFRRAPKAHKFLLECDGKAERGEVLVTPFGRKRRFGLISDVKVQELRNEARNFPIQSIASDLNLSAGRNMESEISALKGMIVNLVHDNTIVEVKDDPAIIKEAILVGTKHMVNAPKIYLNTDVPFEVEVKVGKVWGELKGVE
jgi:DNA polymerase-1